MTATTTDEHAAAGYNWTVFQDAWSRGHDEYTRRAVKQNDFVLGDQWDADLEAELNEAGRPTLTLNEMQRVFRAIHGRYTKTRADITFKPRRSGATLEVAQVLTRLTDHILDSNHYTSHIEPQMFDDGCIEDRGYVDVRVEFDENPLGEVKIRLLDPLEVIPDMDAKTYDPAGWQRVQTVKWMTLDEIEAQYGQKKRDQVFGLAGTPTDTYGMESIRYRGFGDSQNTMPVDLGPEHVKSVRVIDHQYRKMWRSRELMDLETGKTRIVPDHWSNERAQALADQNGLLLHSRVRSRVRWVVSADHVVLYEGWSPYSDFTVVPFFPLFRRGKTSGPMRVIMSPQEQLNKTESQMLHVINTTANSGWLVEQGSLISPTVEELKTEGAVTGLVLTYARNRKPPDKIQPNQIPSGLVNAAGTARGYVQSLAGAEPLLGIQPKTNVSGVAINQQTDNAELGLEMMFENMNFTRQLVGRRILDCVQSFYTERRVFTTTDWRDPEATEEEFEINARAVNALINDIRIGEYEVKAASTPTYDTWQDEQFAGMMELRAAGVQIPDHHVIKVAPLVNRLKIAAEVQHIQGMGEPDEMQIRMAELAVERLEAEIAEMQAKAAEFEARAQHNLARATTEIAGEERASAEGMMQSQMEMARLKADLAKKRADLQAKREIAEIHAESKQALSHYQAVMKQQGQELQANTQIQQEQIRSRTDLLKGALQQQDAQARPEPAESR